MAPSNFKPDDQDVRVLTVKTPLLLMWLTSLTQLLPQPNTPGNQMIITSPTGARHFSVNGNLVLIGINMDGGNNGGGVQFNAAGITGTFIRTTFTNIVGRALFNGISTNTVTWTFFVYVKVQHVRQALLCGPLSPPNSVLTLTHLYLSCPSLALLGQPWSLCSTRSAWLTPASNVAESSTSVIMS